MAERTDTLKMFSYRFKTGTDGVGTIEKSDVERDVGRGMLSLEVWRNDAGRMLIRFPGLETF